MKKREDKGQKGNIMLLVLITFLALAVLGTAVLNLAGMEQRLAIYDTNVKKAQNAADSGLEIVRDFFVRELKNISDLDQNQVNVINDRAKTELVQASPILLPDGSRAIVKEVDVSRLYGYGEVDLVVVGKMGKASRKVTATLSFNTLPVKAVHADKLRIAGTYYLVSDDVPLNVNGYGAWLNAYEGPRWPYVEETAYTIGYGDGNSNIGKKIFWWTDGRDELILPLIGGTGLYKIHYAPYYRAQGKVLADDPSEVWFNYWDDNPVPYSSNLFYPGSDLSRITDSLDPLKWGCVRHEPSKSTNMFKSRHFADDSIKSLSEKGLYRQPPQFTEKHLEKIREVARKEANDPQGKWAYINNGNTTLYLFSLHRPYTFVELNPGTTLNISFGVPPGGNIFGTISNFFYTVVSLFTEGVPGVMLVTPADVRIGFASDFLSSINQLETGISYIWNRVKEAQYLFITPGNINIEYAGKLTAENWCIYALAGRDINIICEDAANLGLFQQIGETFQPSILQSVNRGSFNAGSSINILLKHPSSLGNQISKNSRILQVKKDTRPIESFQERWSLIGIGRIISYKVESGE